MLWPRVRLAKPASTRSLPAIWFEPNSPPQSLFQPAHAVLRHPAGLLGPLPVIVHILGGELPVVELRVDQPSRRSFEARQPRVVGQPRVRERVRAPNALEHRRERLFVVQELVLNGAGVGHFQIAPGGGQGGHGHQRRDPAPVCSGSLYAHLQRLLPVLAVGSPLVRPPHQKPILSEAMKLAGGGGCSQIAPRDSRLHPVVAGHLRIHGEEVFVLPRPEILHGEGQGGVGGSRNGERHRRRQRSGRGCGRSRWDRRGVR